MDDVPQYPSPIISRPGTPEYVAENPPAPPVVDLPPPTVKRIQDELIEKSGVVVRITQMCEKMKKTPPSLTPRDSMETLQEVFALTKAELQLHRTRTSFDFLLGSGTCLMGSVATVGQKMVLNDASDVVDMNGWALDVVAGLKANNDNELRDTFEAMLDSWGYGTGVPPWVSFASAFATEFQNAYTIRAEQKKEEKEALKKVTESQQLRAREEQYERFNRGFQHAQDDVTDNASVTSTASRKTKRRKVAGTPPKIV